MKDLEIQEQAEKMYKSIDQSQLGATFMYAERTAFVKGAKWMQERDKWISVEDRLPEMGVCVLVYIDNGLITCAHRSLKEGINTWELYGDMYAIFDLKYNQVTNWKTLPSPPKTK